MVYPGYLMMGGVEIANAARTYAYADNLMKLFGMKDCWESESLACALGDGEYNTPATDPAPWYDSSRRATAGFFGFYPLSVEGLDSGSRELGLTELVNSDGAVFGLPRHTSKEFRVTGILCGDSQEAVEEGKSWLASTLRGTVTAGACAGDEFCYLAWKPECCDYDDRSTFPLTVADEVTRSNARGAWVDYNDGTLTATSNGLRVQMPCGGDGAQLFLTGLVPGGAYRVTMQMTSTAAVTFEVGGIAERTAYYPWATGSSSPTPWVLDFVAKQETASLRVVNPNAGCTAVEARIHSTKVVRQPLAASTVYPEFNADNFREVAQWDFENSPTLQTAGTAQATSIRVRWKNGTGGNFTLTNQMNALRSLRGLQPGRDYSLMLNVTSNPAGLTPELSVLDADNLSVSSLGENWYKVSFRATQATHVFSISVDSDQVIANGSSIDFNLNYIRLDVAESQFVVASPDQSEAAMRVLYNTALLEGPSTTAIYNKKNGYMEAIEFTMVAAHPFSYGIEREVPYTLDSSTFLMSDIACALGDPVRMNLFTNPLMAYGTAGATAVGGIGAESNFTTNALTATRAAVGTGVARLTPSGASVDSFARVTASGLVEGHTYTFSMDISMDSPQTGSLDGRARKIIIYQNGASADSEQMPNVAGTQRLSVTFVYLNDGWLDIRLYNGSDSPGDIVDYTNFLFEEASSPGVFFSGESDQSEWDGTANRSSSTYTKTLGSVINDPNCDDIPSAPQPVQLTLGCVEPVDEWRRYWIEIPAQYVSGWRDSLPRIVLSTRSESISQVRIRFYPNQRNASLDEINQCAFCGEFYVTYIPPNTVFTIDTILRKVEANVENRGNRNAMNLVTSDIGGPPTWPVLECAQSYFMTVDVAPDEVLDLGLNLSIASRE